jgi:hypothetical protein
MSVFLSVNCEYIRHNQHRGVRAQWLTNSLINVQLGIGNGVVTNISVHVSEGFMPGPHDGPQRRYEPYLSPDMSLMKDDE